MGGLMYGTAAALGRQAGAIAGIKGGDGWMREKFGLHTGWASGFGGGGIMGAASYAKSFFGFGFQGRRGSMALTPQDILSQKRYLETLHGGGSMLRAAESYGNLVADKRLRGRLTSSYGRFRKASGYMDDASNIFRNRKIAGGVGLAAGTMLAANTIGIGNLMMGTGFAAGGAVLSGAMGGALAGRSATAVERAASAAKGRRIGGKLGLGIAGLGIMTGIL